MKNLISKLINASVLIICLIWVNTLQAQTSFDISNQTSGDTLFTIDNSGNVGIGLTNPGAKLDLLLSNPWEWQRGIRALNPDMNSGDRVMLVLGKSDDNRNMGHMNFWYNGDQNDLNRLSFGLYAVNEVLNITGLGNVGIGTTAPTQMLEVADTIRSTVGGFQFPDGTVQETAAGPGSGNGNTLDQAYDQGGAGLGRTITADAGAVTINGVDGLLSTGTFGSGSIPATGDGSRLMWYPNKAAFRVGRVSGSNWDDTNIGIYSMSLGNNVVASGSYSLATGWNTTASGFASTALGRSTVASGYNATATGINTTASGNYSTTFGSQTTASGQYSAAFGEGIEASGSHSVALALSDQTGVNVSQDSTLAVMGGKMGIGTTTPLTQLHVEDSDISLPNTALLNELITVEDLDAGMGLYSANDGNYGSIISLGEISSGVLNNKWSLSRLTSVASLPNQLRFSFGTDPSYAVNPVIWSLSPDGLMGIGTSDPLAGLHVRGSQFPNSFMFLEADAGGDAGIRLYEDGTPQWHIFNNVTAGGLQIYNSGGANTVFFADQSNGNVGIGNTSPSANLHVEGLDGVLFEGTFDLGTIPTTGAGTRFMWYPRKAAIRAGYVNGNQWDDSYIGRYSIAFGENSRASNTNAIAIGCNVTASSLMSTSIGSHTTANAQHALVMGHNGTASGTGSVAIGYYPNATGDYSTAFGFYTMASGDHSTAMGARVEIQGEGSFGIGDNSSVSHGAFTTANRFYARFANGYRLYTGATLSTGAEMLAGANSWSSISDSTKKENFKSIDGEKVLNKISEFRLGSWNYIGQDPKQFRHYGPMAQDFYAAFGHDGIGIIGNDTTIASADFDGVNLIAIQALEKRTSQLQKENEQLRADNSQLKSQMNELTKIVNQMKITMANLQQQNNKSQNITLVKSK